MTFSKQGELVQFLSAGDAKINSCKVYFSPKQAGTGDPSPENVREISGYDGVEVYHCGKNLLPSLDDTTYWENGYFNSNGVGNTRADYRQSKQLVYIRAGQYVFSHPNTYVWIGIYVCDEHANKIYFKESQYNFTVNIPTDGYAKFYVQNIQNCQLELGSTATKYEPYETRISDVLPKEYQEVEYIESTGTQYITTEYYIKTEKVKILSSFYTRFTRPERDLIGNQDNSTGRFVVGCIDYKLFAYARSDQGTETNIYSDVDNDDEKKIYDVEIEYDLESEEKSILINGIKYTGEHTKSIISTNPVQVLADGTSKGAFGCNFYSLKLYDGGNLALNLIPCYRKSDNKPGMYDTVSSTFLTNQGTGEFLIGPKINGYDYDWSSEVGTVYGGYVDLVSGELVKEWEIIASYNSESLASEWLSDRDVYASGMTPTTGAQVTYELVTPVTHQLTPSQLTTLTNQNTFWSNADRIEIEYDLIETRQIEMARRNIIMNSPHVESVTGSNASFITDMASNLKECKIHFAPIQEGSGDPSPENVRPIRGYDSITIYNGQTAVATIPFPQTIYGGYVDLIKGEVVEELSITDLGTVSLSQYSKSNRCWFGAIDGMKFGNAIELPELYCDSYKPLSKKSITSAGEDLSIWPLNTGQRRLIIRNDSYIQEDRTYAITSFKESLQGVMACIPLATPNVYPLDPVTIRTLRGMNNIFSSANGNIEVKFWTH